jgi:hypothetical protein
LIAAGILVLRNPLEENDRNLEQAFENRKRLLEEDN